MKALKCEMCGSNDVVKQEDLFVCQNCGTKYSVESARKMMIEGTVEVKGTVKIDDTVELSNLYALARRAKESNNAENASKYYNQIVVKDPNSWEASFYSLYYDAFLCKAENVKESANSVKNGIVPIIKLAVNEVNKAELEKVIKEVVTCISKLAKKLFNKIQTHYHSIQVGNVGEQGYAGANSSYIEYRDSTMSIVNLMYGVGDSIFSLFREEFGSSSADAWIEGNDIYGQYLRDPRFYSKRDSDHINDGGLMKKERKEGEVKIGEYGAKIRNYYPSYIEPETKITGGCYIATCVYGSYNCPEVWTLRRFRDNTLDATWYGRAFIQTYYSISPTLVKWFGKTDWFKKLWRRPLDKMVASLQEKGVESTPYQDKY